MTHDHKKPVINAGTDYDPTDHISILNYAQQLVGTTLRKRKALPPDAVIENTGKGNFNLLVESCYFGIEPNSYQGPDFPDAGVELKVTPVKRNKSRELIPKERLVVTMIDYMTIIQERFDSSTLESKLNDILFMFYEYEKDKNPLDYVFRLVEEWSIPEEDRPTIKADWETIQDKVNKGLAHEISGGDTMYLEACTKAANSTVRRSQPNSPIDAKPRAFALKQSYMKTVLNRGLHLQGIARDDEQASLDLKTLVKTKFAPFIGKDENELISTFSIGETAKSRYSLISRRILGVGGSSQAKVSEFEKADITLRSLRLKQNDMPKESISFPAFDYMTLPDIPWEESDLYAQLTRPFLFVVYRMGKDESAPVSLERVRFWSMPTSDLDKAKRCYEMTQDAVRRGTYDELPKSSDDLCCHVRPHGRDAQDTSPTPQGTQETKRSFWINASYLKDQLLI